MKSTEELINTIRAVNRAKETAGGQEGHDSWPYCRTGSYIRYHVVLMRGAIVLVAYQYIYSPAFIAIQWTNPTSYIAYYFNGYVFRDINDGFFNRTASRMLSVMIVAKHQTMWLRDWYPHSQPWINCVAKIMERSVTTGINQDMYGVSLRLRSSCNFPIYGIFQAYIWDCATHEEKQILLVDNDNHRPKMVRATDFGYTPVPPHESHKVTCLAITLANGIRSDLHVRQSGVHFCAETINNISSDSVLPYVQELCSLEADDQYMRYYGKLTREMQRVQRFVGVPYLFDSCQKARDVMLLIIRHREHG